MRSTLLAIIPILVFGLFFTACDDDESSGQVTITFNAGDEDDILEAVNDLDDNTRIVLKAGDYSFTNALTIRADQITLEGEGSAEGETVLNFINAAANTNGVDVVGDDFVIKDLAVLNAKKDGVRVEDSTGVTMQNIRASWDNENDSTNGAYGLYPVKSTNVLMEDCEAYNAADAGIYVGQTVNAIIRNNTVSGNVAGLEIENTQNADVYGNTVTDNTGGLLIFDLPGNPIAGDNVLIRDNTVTGNNRENFAPGGTVAEIPPGTGTFVMASRNVEIRGNTYGDNDTIDIAVLSGLLVDSDFSSWGETEDGIAGYISQDIHIHSNTFNMDSGLAPACADIALTTPEDCDQDLGLLTSLIYILLGVDVGNESIDNIWYDGYGTGIIPDAGIGANTINLCVGDNTGDPTMIDINIGGTVDIFASDPALNSDFQSASVGDRQDYVERNSGGSYGNFDCTGITVDELDDF